MRTNPDKIQALRSPLTIALLVASVISAGRALSQPEARPRFDEQMEVTEVLLDVVVTDRGGNLIVGLEPSDFVVLEGDREMELTGVDFYTTRYESAGSGVAEIPASRYIVFFFDDTRTISNRFNRLIQQQIKAARDARKWIEEEMQPSDWVAVTGYGMKLKVFQDFTQNREALTQALTDASRGINPEKYRLAQEPTSDSGASLLRHLPAGKELSRKTRRIYSGMRLLADAMGHIVGRKTLFYFGIGFGKLDGVGGFAIPDRRYYPDMERALNDNNVAVYPVDLTVHSARHAQSDFLNALAYDTGGVYHRHFVSFFTPIKSIADESVGYYLLSYRSEHPQGESGYQRITVGAKVSGAVVRAQRGYRYGS
ncbi:MAG: VWA domain-containing protein [Thermoanaerobaculia bacterium]